MRRSYRSARNEDMCRCCLLPLLTAMGLALFGAIHFVIIYDKFNNRMDRIADKYDNAINATTNSSTCQGSLYNFYDRDDCPSNEPCHDYCKNYIAAANATSGPIVGLLFFSCAFVMGASILFISGGLNVIENFRNFISNCRRAPDKHDAYVSFDDYIESLRVVRDRSVNTSHNSTRRFLTDQKRSYEGQKDSSLRSPSNVDGRSPKKDNQQRVRFDLHNIKKLIYQIPIGNTMNKKVGGVGRLQR